MINRLAVLITLLVSISPVYAGKWTGPITIDDIYVWNSTFINIRVNPYINPENCTDTQGYQISSTSETEWIKRMYSQILTAYTSGKQISFLLEGCGSKPMIKAISYTQPQSQ